MTQKEKNLEIKRKMEEAYQMPIEKIAERPDFIFELRTIYGARCVECGGKFTLANLKFYNFRLDEVKCYTCQNKKEASQPLRDLLYRRL